MAKILIGRQTICDHLGISPSTLYRLMAEGLPVVNINKTLCSHSDNLDDFFRKANNKKKDKSARKKGP